MKKKKMKRKDAAKRKEKPRAVTFSDFLFILSRRRRKRAEGGKKPWEGGRQRGQRGKIIFVNKEWKSKGGGGSV